MTELQHFKELVAEMRKYQRAFFSSQHGSKEKATALHKSKQLEKKVDEYLSNPGLFSDDLL